LIELRPDPDAGLVMVIQLALLAAVQPQLEPVTIETLPLKPVDGAETAVGEIE
jgi:hypothetical protein